MPEALLAAHSALEREARSGRQGNLVAEPGVVFAELTGLGIASVIARKGMVDGVAKAVLAAFGVALPLTPRRVMADGIAFIWAGPERWLAVTDRESSEALAKSLTRILPGLASIAAQGDGRAVIRFGGPRARDVLAKGFTIDLHPRAFRPGDTAVTGAAHIEVHIWQIDDAPTYEIALFRGFAQSFWHWLTQSAAEFGYEISTDA